MLKFSYTFPMQVIVSAKCPTCDVGQLQGEHKGNISGYLHICNTCKHEESLPERYPQYKTKRIILPEGCISDYC